MEKKLDEKTVAEIRKLARKDIKQVAIARQFKISEALVSSVVQNKSYVNASYFSELQLDLLSVSLEHYAKVLYPYSHTKRRSYTESAMQELRKNNQ